MLVRGASRSLLVDRRAFHVSSPILRFVVAVGSSKAAWDVSNTGDWSGTG